MSQKKIFIGIAAAVLIVGAWYAFRPERLFIDQTVNESLEATSSPAAGAEMGAAEPDVVMAETMPVGAPARLAEGSFHTNAHETKGLATIYRLEDGRRVLRLTGFATSNGPDVRVLLVAAADVNDDATVKQAGYVELGKLKGNIGDQNYDVPESVDLARYGAVTIWCNRFSVNFGTAPLAAVQS